ncbi:ATP-binding protein [Halarsenatibacter silvermanii]|uniref:Serine/threonine-protein kinase RsbW n=1 Tax=Halarsenatibacter silvermanii TaxID=321763 RepID=A0A1G9IZ37_9FIRM|nr:ATP-binding protein [Halarsenatibacter silvermanii]SDL30527.1 serine/threonine-protein kinase RsbW [Halarsenatibacter silvermanii]
MSAEKMIETDLTMACQAELVADTVEEIIDILADADHGVEDLNFRLELAAREMLANALEHGCSSPEEEARVEISAHVGRVEISVKDPGDGFDWRQADMENMPVLEEKGRGLNLINQVADELEFNEDGNAITAVFT